MAHALHEYRASVPATDLSTFRLLCNCANSVSNTSIPGFVNDFSSHPAAGSNAATDGCCTNQRLMPVGSAFRFDFTTGFCCCGIWLFASVPDGGISPRRSLFIFPQRNCAESLVNRLSRFNLPAPDGSNAIGLIRQFIFRPHHLNLNLMSDVQTKSRHTIAHDPVFVQKLPDQIRE